MAEVLMINPKKRRKTTKKRKKTMAVSKHRSRRKTTVARKRRRNPSARKSRGLAGIVNNTLIPSATAAGGALALDVAWGMLPIPENLKTGPIRHVAKAAGAVGIGMLAGMFAKASTANLIATGAMTVVMHGAGKEMLSKIAPNLTLGDYDDDYEALSYAGAGWEQEGELDADTMGEYMGEYMGESDDGMGLYEPSDISEMGEYEDADIEL